MRSELRLMLSLLVRDLFNHYRKLLVGRLDFI